MIIGFVAIFFGVPATLVAIGAAIWVWREGLRGTALGLCAFALLIEAFLLHGGYVEMHYWDGYDLNPHVEATELVGTWRLRQETLTINADGTFVASDGGSGAWLLGNCSCFSAGVQEWWVLRKADELLILKTTWHSDADEWNKHRAFSRDR